MCHELETTKGRWAKTVDKFRQKLGMTWDDLREISK